MKVRYAGPMSSYAAAVARFARRLRFACSRRAVCLTVPLVMLLPLTVYLYQRYRQRRYLAAGGLLLLAAFSTVSRTAFVMLLVIAFVYLLLRPGATRRLWPILIRHKLVADVWRPLVELTRRRHLRFRKHDVGVFHLLDPLELEFNFRRPMRFIDMEGGPAIFAEPSDIAARYQKALDEYSELVGRGSREARALRDELNRK